MEYPKPITEGKGKKGQNCNRTACQKPNSAFYYNKGTHAYYCRECAERINHSAIMDGFTLFDDLD